MSVKTIKELTNHKGHVLNLAEVSGKVLLECMTCQEVILTCGGTEDTGELFVIKDVESEEV